ncbi:para-aminobenzoate synthase, subunit I [Shewanella sediminis HAW-EB3]|uniref:aminodeoxychorismate synthase n=1 Tax=Shewanella sediminis (strain HAW-EB3) TaxID=425104 RepID=A8FVU5_SHESH|nr:aminodeoxychorismate synthase component I [Shewanella sediminis]ABV36968.1 para-aminobenzoate synthase, subunit I [Shewanella sediminis HAW-EB3]
MSFSPQQQLAFRHLNWKYTTTELFSHLADKPWAMLLDSADAAHLDAKFDIIVCDPIATIVTDGQSSRVNHLQDGEIADSQVHSGDPFTLLNDTINHYFPHQYPSPLPFSGGAVGCFSYDLGRQIEHLPQIAARDILLPEMNVGLYPWALIFDRLNACWTLAHYHGEAPLESTLAQLNTLLEAKPNSVTGDFSLTSQWINQITKSQYIEKFDKIQSYLNSGDCYQINLTQRFTASYRGDEWRAYLKLRETNRAPFSAFIRLDDAAILSISPERFIQLRDGQVQTKPIKGTRPRFENAEADTSSALELAESEKDRAENLMIVDLLRNDIGKVAKAGSVKVPHLFQIDSFPAVHHLVSTVTAELHNKYQATDLLKAAFPGGSITGAPKIRAMQIIEELEPSRRSLYCGSIGYISQDGQMDTSITIRTLVAQANHIHCWAGGGIVADSQANDEYQETFDKVSKILPVLEKVDS